MMHLVNFEKNIIEDINVNLRTPPKRRVEKISVLSPDFEGFKSIEYTEIEDRVLFKVPKLMTYDLILIQLK